MLPYSHFGFSISISFSLMEQDSEKIILVEFRGHVMKMTQDEYDNFIETLEEWE